MDTESGFVRKGGAGAEAHLPQSVSQSRGAIESTSLAKVSEGSYKLIFSKILIDEGMVCSKMKNLICENWMGKRVC